MIFEYELDFLCDILQKCHVGAAVLSPDECMDALSKSRFKDSAVPSGITAVSFTKAIENNTQYRIIDEFKLCHIYFRLPIQSEKCILLIGPYLREAIEGKDVLEIGEQMGITPAKHGALEEYYSALPILRESDSIFNMIDTFCEHIWRSPSFAIVEVHKNDLFPASPIMDTSEGADFEHILDNVNMMEARYAFENELIRAVQLGQRHKEHIFTTALNHRMFEKRVSDPVRNAKNYSIIMNTLLRKAAEQGGVHPIYIDKVSSKFASRIEQITSLDDNITLMKDMFDSYCRLVYKHSTKKFSPLVQKAVLIIDSDLSADLSLHNIAQLQGISSGYLATIFKKETGKTVSEYVRDKRVSHAKYLLTTTNLQIQTVALHCGIVDVQYFSKIFKSQTGKTPREYRESLSVSTAK